MSPQLFVKFHYKDRIKKTGFTEEDFTWENVCKMLLTSFGLPTNSIKLTYKDSDGDEITVCCDEDLGEVFKLFSESKLIRFYVYKCGPVLMKARTMSDDSTTNLEQTCNSFKERSYTASFSENNIPDIKNYKLDRIPSVVKEVKEEKNNQEEVKEEKIKVEEEKSEIKLGEKELSDILKILFSTNEGKKQLHEIKRKYKSSNNSEDAKSAKFTVSIADTEALCKNLVETLNTVINENEEGYEVLHEENEKKEDKKHIDLNKSIDSEIATEEEYKSLEERNIIKNDKTPEKNFFNASLKESIYGDNQFNNTLRERRPVNDFKTRSLSQTYGGYCKDLSSTFGVKLALKCVDGKMKMVSVPVNNDYCIIEADEPVNVNKDQKDLGAGLPRSSNEKVIQNSSKEQKEMSLQEKYSDLYKQLLVD